MLVSLMDLKCDRIKAPNKDQRNQLHNLDQTRLQTRKILLKRKQTLLQDKEVSTCNLIETDARLADRNLRVCEAIQRRKEEAISIRM